MPISSRPVLVVAAIGAFAFLPACASQRQARFESAIASEHAPQDFWLAVTVLRVPAETSSRAAAYLRAPLASRPARYVVEADRILRVAVGSGATDETFPDQTRQLSQEQFDDLWRMLRSSTLIENDHPSEVGTAPTVASLGERTVYVVSFSVGGDRRTLAIDADPSSGPAYEDASKLVEKLAGLAWMK